MAKVSKMKSKMDPADNGKGFKKMAKGKETGGKKWTPPWAKGAAKSAVKGK